MRSVIELVDVMKVSDEESILVAEERKSEEEAAHLPPGTEVGCHYIGRTERSYGNKKQKKKSSKHFRHMRSTRLGQVIHSGEAYYAVSFL